MGSECLIYYQPPVLFQVNTPSYWHVTHHGSPESQSSGSLWEPLWWGLTVWDSTVKQQPEGLSRCWVPCACSPITSRTIGITVLGVWFWHGLYRLWNWQKEKLFQRVTEMLHKCFVGSFSFWKYIWGHFIFSVSDLFNRWWQLVENYFL